MTDDEARTWQQLTDAARPLALNDPVSRSELAQTALRAVKRLADRWHLSAEQTADLLGGIPVTTWHAWQVTPPRKLTADQLTRVSLLLGIAEALRDLHPGPLADSWVPRANTKLMFAGDTPLHMMMTRGIPALVEVRSLLDGRRNG